MVLIPATQTTKLSQQLLPSNSNLVFQPEPIEPVGTSDEFYAENTGKYPQPNATEQALACATTSASSSTFECPCYKCNGSNIFLIL